MKLAPKYLEQKLAKLDKKSYSQLGLILNLLDLSKREAILITQYFGWRTHPFTLRELLLIISHTEDLSLYPIVLFCGKTGEVHSSAKYIQQMPRVFFELEGKYREWRPSPNEAAWLFSKVKFNAPLTKNSPGLLHGYFKSKKFRINMTAIHKAIVNVIGEFGPCEDKALLTGLCQYPAYTDHKDNGMSWEWINLLQIIYTEFGIDLVYPACAIAANVIYTREHNKEFANAIIQIIEGKITLESFYVPHAICPSFKDFVHSIQEAVHGFADCPPRFLPNQFLLGAKSKIEA